MLTQLFQSVAVPVGNLAQKEPHYSKVDSVYKNKQEKKKEYQENETAFTDAEGMEGFGHPNFIGNKLCLNQRYFPHMSHMKILEF